MFCPVCRSENPTFLFLGQDLLHRLVPQSFSVFRCGRCHALFLDPYPSQKETENFYPKTYYSYQVAETEGFFDRLKRNIIKSHTESDFRMSLFDRVLVRFLGNRFAGLPLYRKKNGRFLDIGCGNGKNVKIVAQYGWDAYGIELDERAVANARSQGLRVEQSSLEAAAFPREHFDVIRIWHVFEHLTEPHGALEKIKNMLAPEGEILMALPNAESWARRLFRSCWYNLDVPRHVVNYSPKTLFFLTQQHGLKITELRYASCGWFIGSFSHFLRKRFGYQGDLINSLPLVLLFAPLDFLSDILRGGDVIFLRIKKQ